jgi:hypothetical protein
MIVIRWHRDFIASVDVKAIRTRLSRMRAGSVRGRGFSMLLVVFLAGLLLSGRAYARDAVQAAAPDSLVLSEAVMCEEIQNFGPHGPGIVFSVNRGRVFCFTRFESVARETTIYHNWYHRDRLITTRRLAVQAPAWSTYSSIQLRDADRGPWRVEICLSDGAIVKTLRFSLVE